jgi:signal peptidase II
VIPGFFQIAHVENTGAAFGLLAGYEHAMWVFAVFTLVAMGVLISLFRELPSDSRLMPLALGAILAGALGNAIDRVHKQGVTDFLRFYIDHDAFSAWLIKTFGTNEYPSFNVADMAICLGVALFLGNELRTARRPSATPEATPAPPAPPARVTD